LSAEITAMHHHAWLISCYIKEKRNTLGFHPITKSGVLLLCSSHLPSYHSGWTICPFQGPHPTDSLEGFSTAIISILFWISIFNLLPDSTHQQTRKHFPFEDWDNFPPSPVNSSLHVLTQIHSETTAVMGLHLDKPIVS
jgi:hypothetical protein